MIPDLNKRPGKHRQNWNAEKIPQNGAADDNQSNFIEDLHENLTVSGSAHEADCKLNLPLIEKHQQQADKAEGHDYQDEARKEIQHFRHVDISAERRFHFSGIISHRIPLTRMLCH